MPVAVTDPPAEHDNTELAASATADHCPPCPCCGGRLIIVESFGRGGAPRGRPPVRHELGFSTTESRFPTKGTCLDDPALCRLPEDLGQAHTGTAPDAMTSASTCPGPTEVS
jgi:hypothetical protein